MRQGVGLQNGKTPRNNGQCHNAIAERCYNGTMEQRNGAAMERCYNGTMPQWNNGTVPQWNNGTMPQRSPPCSALLVVTLFDAALFIPALFDAALFVVTLIVAALFIAAPFQSLNLLVLPPYYTTIS